MFVKIWIFLFMSLCLTACSNEVSEPEPVSTVDSNVAEPSDTVLPELYMDNESADTGFSIALDSSGKTILPDDTNYQKKP